MAAKGTILMVLTSNSTLGSTDKKTGYWLEEAAAPYYTFVEAGFKVVVASPAGGAPPVDPGSAAEGAATAHTRKFEGDAAAKAVFAATAKISDVKAADFAAVFYPGSHARMDITAV